MSESQDISNRKDAAIFDLQNIQEDDNKKCTIQFHLSSEIININFHLFCKYSHIVQKQFQQNNLDLSFIQNLEQIQQKYKIKDESIKIFFKLIQEEKVQITSDYYIDLLKLSEIFVVNSLKILLKNYAEQFSHDLNFIINLLIEQKSNENDDIFQIDYVSNDMESLLSQNIDECFKNKKFGLLPIPFIHRIIEKSDKVQISSDLLYNFILSDIENRCVLLYFLDIKKLSDKNFEDLYQKNLNEKDSNIYFQYLPNDIIYLRKLKCDNHCLCDEIRKLKEEKAQIENQNKELKTKLFDQSDKNNQLKIQINELNKTIDQLNQNNNQINLQLNNLMAENKKLHILNNTDIKEKAMEACVEMFDKFAIQITKSNPQIKNILFNIY